ncbi:putative RNA demethylase ALKBH9B/ALKBH10B [Helianthus debilis subsp. tardiflorus]
MQVDVCIFYFFSFSLSSVHMAAACGVSASSDQVPMIIPVQPTMMPEAYAKDAIISWFRGEFVAANALIDTLCGHLSQLEAEKPDYETVFAVAHCRRLNRIPILQMQKCFFIADVRARREILTWRPRKHPDSSHTDETLRHEKSQISEGDVVFFDGE